MRYPVWLPLLLAVLVLMTISPIALAQEQLPDFSIENIGVTETLLLLVRFDVVNNSTQPYSGPLMFTLWDTGENFDTWPVNVNLGGMTRQTIVSEYSLVENAVDGSRGEIQVGVDSTENIDELSESNNVLSATVSVPLRFVEIGVDFFQKKVQVEYTSVDRPHSVIDWPVINLPLVVRRAPGQLGGGPDERKCVYAVRNTFSAPMFDYKHKYLSSQPGATEFTLDVPIDFSASFTNFKGKRTFEAELKLVEESLPIAGARTLLSKAVPFTVRLGRTQTTGARRWRYATIMMGEPKRTDRACPFFYLLDRDGRSFVKAGELIRDLVGVELESLERTPIDRPVVREGKITVLIREEKQEVSYLDYVALEVDGRILSPRLVGNGAAELVARDDTYFVLEEGEELRVEFDVGLDADIVSATILTEGYYLPKS